MAAPPTAADWIARGRPHQWEGRPVDAMLCFERAARVDPRSFEARFYLGEVRWQLGLATAAVGAWREAVDCAPHAVAPRLALAEALLFTGEAQAAAEVADQTLRIAPTEPRALVLRAVARYARGERAVLQDVVALATHDPAPFAAPAIGTALANAWLGDPGNAHGGALADALAPTAGSLPWALLVAMAGHRLSGGQPDGLVDLACQRPLAAGEIDGLRRLALAARGAGNEPGWTRLSARYAELAASAFAPAHPLLWPVRAAGSQPRMALVAAPVEGAGAERQASLAAALAQDNAVTLWLLAPEGTSVPAVFATVPGVTARAWTGPLGGDFAAALAAADPDLLVDLAGLDWPLAPVLAVKPARAIVSLSRFPYGAPLAEPGPDPFVADADAADRDLAPTVGVLGTRARAAAASAPTGVLAVPERAALWERAISAHREGDRERARAGYDRVLAESPTFAPARYLRATLARDAGENDIARGDLEAALTAAPGYVQARVAAVRLASEAHDAERAKALAHAGLQRSPNERALLLALGEAQLAARDAAAATRTLGVALAHDPTDADAHFKLGIAAQTRGDVAEAARAYQRALVFRPDFADAHFNLGVLFQEQGNADGALAAYRRVVALDPHRTAAWRNAGEVLLAAGRIDAFLDSFARFEAACPDALALAVQALEACAYRADFARLEHYLEGLRQERFRAGDETELVDCLEQLLYLLLFFDVGAEVILRFARTYDASAPRVYGPPLAPPAARRPGPIRLGYLSGDLRDHVMGKMIWEAVARHDRERFQLYFYATSGREDAWTAKFRGIAHAFVDLSGMHERDAARRIAEDDLDLLVDLSTHTRGAKPGILAAKPARVQITHIASAGTVGLSTIDFKLTDRYADLPGNQEFQIEALLPMEGCVYPWRSVVPATVHPYHREQLGIPAGAVVIGAFVTPLKLSRRCLMLWRDVLTRIPQAVLAFSPNHPGLKDVYLRLAAAASIAPERLLFLPQAASEAENLARYGIVDLVLDPMPFGGVNGVLEPLSMGVPVVTLAGRRHGERTGYSILANLGVTATVAASGSEYVDLAVRLATDAAFRQDVKDAIVGGLAASPLTDMTAHARNLEAAYREALTQKAPQVLAEQGGPP